MIIFTRLSSIMLVLLLMCPGYADASDVKTVLERLIHAYGGESNLRKMDNTVQEWDLVALMGNRHGSDIRSVHAPGQLRVELSYPDKSETRILNGDTAHVIFGGKPSGEVSTMQRDAMRLQLMRLYSPLMLRDKIDSIGLLEQGDLLALSLAENGVHVHYMVNKENWRIEKVAGTLTINGSEMQFLTEYSNFELVDGVLMHHRENKFAGGMNTAMLQLRKIEFDVQFDESRFEP